MSELPNFEMLLSEVGDRALAVSWGGGVNSTALLLGLLERGIIPDCILFADTGLQDAEKPETYAYFKIFRRWLNDRGYPAIEVVRNDGMHRTLESNCITNKTLPSLAFGFKGCSEKYKKRPQLKFLKARFGDLSTVVQAIGIHAGEAHRAKQPSKPPFSVHPLIEWDWGTEECRSAILRHGLPIPPKSACFFCPASTLPEIRWLKEAHPDLLARALEMEDNAMPHLDTVKGLGRRFSWRQVIEAHESELKMLPAPIEMDCMCFDGHVDE